MNPIKLLSLLLLFMPITANSSPIEEDAKVLIAQFDHLVNDLDHSDIDQILSRDVVITWRTEDSDTNMNLSTFLDTIISSKKTVYSTNFYSEIRKVNCGNFTCVADSFAHQETITNKGNKPTIESHPVIYNITTIGNTAKISSIIIYIITTERPIGSPTSPPSTSAPKKMEP